MSLPDIDIDFCERRRGEVIDYVTRKYGRENVAQIITFGTMKARAVVRDVARVMDIPYADADRVAKAVPPALDMTLEKALEESPALKEMEQKDERVKELLAVARRLEGHDAARLGPRRRRRHCAAAADRVRSALQESQKDEIVTQWAMKEVERVGLLKMDFLGLSTLTLIRDCLDEIKRTEGIDLDIDAIPLDDAKTYKLFCDGQTYGVFQFESSGHARAAAQGEAGAARRPDRAQRALPARPAQERAWWTTSSRASRARPRSSTSCRSSRRSCQDTYGVIAYQEQVMRIARGPGRVLDGPVGRAAQGHGQERSQGHGQAARSVHGRRREAKGVSEKKAKKIFDLMEFFAGYGFNKSHSTTYAWVAYQTAYLKANYPSHFMAALLTIEAANTDKLAMYLGECRELGVPILPPDINPSQLRVHRARHRRAVRFGLRCAVKNVGEGAILSMLGRPREAGPDRFALHAVRSTSISGS